MADIVFPSAKALILNQQLNLLTDDIRVMLVNDEFVPDATMVYVDDGGETSPSNFEIDAMGYEPGCCGTGRKALQNKAITTNTETERVSLNADDVSWNPLNTDDTRVGGILIWKRSTAQTDATSPVIYYTSSGGFPKQPDGGMFEVRWGEEGILAF